MLSDDEEFDFTEVNTKLTFMPTDSFEIGIGNRFLNDHPFFEDSNLITLSMYKRFGDRLGASAWLRFEADDSTLESQYYTLHYDMNSWTAGVGGVVRDHRGTEEFGVVLVLTLKEFPQVSLPLELSPGGAGN